MIASKTAATLLLTTLILAGCATPFQDDEAKPWLAGDLAQWRVTPNGPPHNQQTLALPVETAAAAPPGLTAAAGPDDYVRLALARNPSIRAAERRVARLAQDIPQVTSLDDPMFQFSPVGEMGEMADGKISFMTMLSQKLPFPGKLDAQGRIAAQEIALATEDLRSTRLGVIADTRRAYWSYYYAARAIEVTRENQQLLAQFRQIAQAKYIAGTATQQDVLRASVDLNSLDNELITLQQRQTTAAAMLNSLLDQSINAPLPMPKTVELTQLSLQLDKLLAAATVANPALQALHQRIEQSRQRLKLARLNRWPDLTMAVNYNAVDPVSGMGSSGSDQWWLTFGINLPIWQRKLNAAEQGALKGILEGVADLTAEQNRVAFNVQDALVKVQTQQRQAMLFRDVIVPQAQQTVDLSVSDYRTGKSDFLTLADNWRKLLDFELLYHQSLTEFQQSLADLQQVVGADVTAPMSDGKSAELKKGSSHGN